MATFSFNVYLKRKKIDTVWYDVSGCDTVAEMQDAVKKYLVDHEGYDNGIKVRIAERVTKTTFELMTDYGYGPECLCAGETMKEARRNKKDYQKNDPRHYWIEKRLTKLF